MPIFFFALAIYTLITLLKTAADISRNKLNLSVDPPSGRCIPFFDHILDWKKDNNNSIVLYDYIGGQAIALICTHDSSTSVTAAITKFDGAVAYTPFDLEGCPLSQYRAQIGNVTNSGCVRVGTETNKYSCNQILNFAPCDAVCLSASPPSCCTDVGGCCQGYGFRFDVQEMTGNTTDTSTGRSQPYPKCTIRFEYLEGLPECRGSWVGIFNTKSANLVTFSWIVVAVPIVVNIAQVIMLAKFDPAPPFDDDHYVSFAMRGISGPIYNFWWIFCSGRDLAFPKAKLTLVTWLACLTQDLIEGLAAPIVAIHGCHLSRFVVPFALIIVKCIKILVDIFMYFKDDDGENEPAVTKSLEDPNLTAAGMFGSPMNQPMTIMTMPQQQQPPPMTMMMVPQQQQQPMMMVPQQQQPMMMVPQQQQQQPADLQYSMSEV